MKRLTLLASLVLAFAGAATAAEGPEAADPRGRWVTSSGNLEVEVASCGDALCGTVVRVLANHSMQPGGGEMKPADARDPMGMKLLIDFVPTAFAEAGARRHATEWRGQIYNRENAKTYSCVMTLGDGGELLLRGYVGLTLFGRTSTWRRTDVSQSAGR
jgi:uncharacterized protein (DUF2147 family)